MPKNVFLSFVVEDLTLVNLFRGQARNRNSDLEFSDFSVREPYNSTNADYIRSQIRDRINAASVLLCLIGPTTHTSQWVDWEIKTASALGKRIGGVRLHSAPVSHAVPRALVDAGGSIMGWDIAAIVKWLGT